MCCPTCGKKVTKEYLEKHIRLTHEGKYDNVPCHICGQVFKRTSDLNEHNNQKHSDDPKYKCDYCPMRFGNGYIKNHHMLSHKEAYLWKSPENTEEFDSP